MITIDHPTTSEPSPKAAEKLVDANGLLEVLFDSSARPSLRWLRQMQAQRKIPYIKLGHLVRFDVEEVREALRNDCTVHSRRHLRKNK
jgi:hypothetical protein